jgi:hypothetical protein
VQNANVVKMHQERSFYTAGVDSRVDRRPHHKTASPRRVPVNNWDGLGAGRRY